MQVRFSSWALLPVAVALTIAGCTNPSQVDSISVTPQAPPAINIAQTLQFTATGTYNHAAPHPPTQQDLTDSVEWSSSNPQVATISPIGLATAVGGGTATITASINGFTGLLTSTATLTVTVPGSGNGSGNGTGTGSGTEQLLSINIVPGGITVSNQGMTGKFLAFGTFSTPPLVRDITNEVTWISLEPEVASIDSYGAPGASGSGGASGELAGLATAEGYTGFSAIYAEDTTSNKDGTIVLSNSETFTCKAPDGFCDPGVALPQFSTVTVFVEGENTSPTGEYVTAPTDTGTSNLIHCGPDWTGTGGQVCTGTYEVGTQLTLTENLPAGSPFFGGWSTGSAETLTCTIVSGASPSNTCSFNDPNNPAQGWSCTTVTTGTGATAVSTSSCFDPIPCTPAVGTTLLNSPTCTLPLYGNATVGVIFY